MTTKEYRSFPFPVVSNPEGGNASDHHYLPVARFLLLSSCFFFGITMLELKSSCFAVSFSSYLDQFSSTVDISFRFLL